MGNIKLKTKFAGLIIALIAVSLVANLAWTSENKRAQMENELREKGMVLTQQMDAVWEFMASNQDRLEQNPTPTTACTRASTALSPAAA